MVDLWGMGLGHISFARDFLAVAVKQTVLLYPETLDRVLVLNAASWRIQSIQGPFAKPFLPQPMNTLLLKENAR